MLKKLRLLGCILSLFSSLHAQTTLSAGDIAIIGTNYDILPYEMSIVNLVPISAGTDIRITDYGYDEATGTFGTTSVTNTAEGSITWTLTAAMPAGTVTKFSITGGTTPSVSGLPGIVNVIGWTLTNPASCPIPGGGDNWFIFQGSSPTSVSQYVFGFMNTFGTTFNGVNQPAGQFLVTGSGLQPNNSNSYLPPSLTLGSSAIAINRDPNSGGYHGDNNVYTGIRSGTKAAILAAICLNTGDRNTDNWLSDEIITYDINPGGAYFPGTNPIFTVIAPCALSLTAAAQTNVSCFGGTTGAASVNTATGGSGDYSYNWTPGNPTGDGTVSVTGLSAGNWTCTVTDNTSGCSTTRDFTITQPTVLSLTPASQTNVSCNGGSNGAATVNSATGGAGGYTYNWTPGTPTGDGTTSVTGLSPGSWTCTVTDGNGCTATSTFTITQPTAIVATAASQTNVSCFGGSNGAASINIPTGGAGGYTYNWTPGNPTGDGTTSVTGLTAGIWTCTVTDANGCTRAQNFTVTQTPAISVTPASQTNVSCFGGSNGAAAINTPTGGAGGYTYNWTPGNPTGDGTTSVTGLTAGTWTCTVTDANGCTRAQNFTVTQTPAISVTPASQTNVSCFGGSNGAAAINTPTGGAGGYTYNWTPGNPTGDGTTSVTGLTAGIWTCTVTDANGCTSAQNFTVTQSPAISVTPASQTNVSCFGGSNGAAAINTPTGGAGGYTYNWTPGTPTGDGTTSVTGLTAGTWTCTVTDANGCTRTQNFTVTQPTAISTATAAQTNVSCNGGSNGSASVTPSGGAGGYTYSWSPAGGTAATATGLSAGTYTVTVTDANGCTATRNFTITQPTAISTATAAQTNVSCNGGSNGSASVTPSGGAGGYTYSWSPAGGTAATATGLSAGTYTVTVTDANSCTATRNFTITQPTSISTSTAAQTNVSCNGGSNGSASVTPSGGAGGYTYSWSPAGGTAATATGLSAGTYTVTVTDANGCTATRNFTITQPTAISTATAAQTNVSCNGGSNGSASVTPSGGAGGYTYSWSPAGGTAATATGLAAGTYTVTVTDANGCTATRNFTITQPTAISTATAAQTNVSCNGGSNGSASVTPSGGAGGYTYSWSPAGGTAATATGLAAGTYTVTVTDANGCTATRNFTITQPTAISTATAAQTNVSCNGGSNGSASVTPSGGAGGYSYSWSPTGGTAATATGLSAGTYTVTVTDANGCTATRNFTITQPTAISTATAAQTNVSCNGGSNGSASVTPSGGAGGYTYSWSPAGGTAATATGLSAGTYTVTVTDVNGCTATRNFTITQPTAINNAVTLNAGILEATQTSATYQWYLCPNTILAGETNQTFTPTVVGDYKVEISVGGCSTISACTTVTTLKNDSFDSTNFSFYPNPTSDLVYINNGNEIEEVVITNLLGQQVYYAKFMDKDIQINLTSFPSTTYFLKIKSEGKYKTIKIVKN